jgi:hypothetical protein
VAAYAAHAGTWALGGTVWMSMNARQTMAAAVTHCITTVSIVSGSKNCAKMF